MEKTNFPVEEPGMVIKVSGPEDKEEKMEVSVTSNAERCRNCGTRGGIIREMHCITCFNCGWSSCEIW